MIHRIFLAVTLSAKTKAELFALREQCGQIPARWTKPENLHVTVEFLGNMSDREIEALKEVTEKVARAVSGCAVVLDRLSYGPNVKAPRMIWARGTAPKDLIALHQALREGIEGDGRFHVTFEEKPFSLHVTLARLDEWKFREIDLEERPDLDRQIEISFAVAAIDIMESNLKPAGPEYKILASFPLGA